MPVPFVLHEDDFLASLLGRILFVFTEADGGNIVSCYLDEFGEANVCNQCLAQDVKFFFRAVVWLRHIVYAVSMEVCLADSSRRDKGSPAKVCGLIY